MKVRDISLEVMDISEEAMATRIYESTPMWLPSNSISSPLMLALLCLLLCAGHHFKQDVEDYIGVDWYIFKVDSFGFGLKMPFGRNGHVGERMQNYLQESLRPVLA